jgi:hypothetical protein
MSMLYKIKLENYYDLRGQSLTDYQTHLIQAMLFKKILIYFVGGASPGDRGILIRTNAIAVQSNLIIHETPSPQSRFLSQLLNHGKSQTYSCPSNLRKTCRRLSRHRPVPSVRNYKICLKLGAVLRDQPVTCHQTQTAANARRTRNAQVHRRSSHGCSPSRSHDCHPISSSALQIHCASCVVRLAVAVCRDAGGGICPAGCYVRERKIGICDVRCRAGDRSCCCSTRRRCGPEDNSSSARYRRCCDLNCSGAGRSDRTASYISRMIKRTCRPCYAACSSVCLC